MPTPLHFCDFDIINIGPHFPSTFEKTETFCSHFIVVGNGIFQ